MHTYGRMPASIFYYLRCRLKAFIVFLFVVSFSVIASPAHADPHAVFYTDRAQEQLFYNVLAALNQADFVEPATGQFSRENLTQARENVIPPTLPGQSPNPFQREQNSILNATRSALPGVVTRSITLEGNDLWSSYLFQQFAKEIDVRKQLAKLSRIICTDALGQTGCNNQPGPSQNQSTAFPTNIDEYANQEDLALVSTLSSGSETEADFQDKLVGNTPVDATQPANVAPEPSVPENIKFPRPASAEIAALRGGASGSPEALGLVAGITDGIIAAQYNTGLDPSIFSKFTISNTGDVKLPDNATFDDYLDVLRGVASLVPASIEIADRGREQGLAFQQYREQTPALAKYTLTKEQAGGVTGTINIPSTAIEAQINSGAQLLANQTINQNIASTQEITTPGTKPALSNPQTSTTPPPTGSVSGATDRNNGSSSQEGKVAGIVDFALQIANLYNQYYSQPQPNPNTPTTGLIPFYEEKGPDALLEALGGTNPNPNPSQVQCGFCVALDQIIKTGGVTGTINEVYTDMYCFFFPRTEYCTARKT